MVSSGSGSNSRSMLAISVSKSPPGRSVRPIDPANSTSPLKTTPWPTKQMLPGECPAASASWAMAWSSAATCCSPNRSGEQHVAAEDHAMAHEADAAGHSPGSICFVGHGVVFSGDVLFAGSIGRTDLPGGDFETLIASIERELLPLPDDTIVYSGHGPETTIGRERRTNPFLTGVHRIA